MSLFPPRASSRKPFRSPYWSQRWPKFMIPVAMVAIILQLLFLANMSYLYGVIFKSVISHVLSTGRYLSQGSRVLFNTVSMVMPILMLFFFSMAMNGIFTEAGVFSKLSKRDTYILRLIISKLYTLLCAVGTCGYIWAFREDWSVSRGQFFETWMCLWFYMEVNYLVVDSILDVVVPIKFFAFFFLTWIILNVAGTVYPFELSAGFYRWAYALPAHNTWTLLMTIWSGGCKAQNEVALPVLFVWWSVGHVTSAWAVRRRCLVNEVMDDDAKTLQANGPVSVMKDPEQ